GRAAEVVPVGEEDRRRGEALAQLGLEVGRSGRCDSASLRRLFPGLPGGGGAMVGRRAHIGAVVAASLWAATASAQQDGGVTAAAPGQGDAGGAAVGAPGTAAASPRDAGYQDETDLFKAVGWGGKEEKAHPEPYKLYPSILPAVGYSPSVGALIGVVGQFGMYLGDPQTTTISSMQATLLFTSKSQVLFQVFSSVQTAGDLWQFVGDWRLLLYNQEPYGLRTGPPPVKYRT